ncbi:transglutaminase-like enzyme [alpha proteobacterium U9-1i]|nr:transglutaminase-like enzyme [alpha proteobacterium U9-1i]
MDDTAPQDGAGLAPGVTRAPIPGWVELEAYARPASPNPHFIAQGSAVLLDEVQVDLCGSERGWFHRRAEMVTAHGGAERVAQFSASLDPAFERLEIHSVRVLRGEREIDHTFSDGFQVLRREQNLERLIFDGRLTIHFTIPDVRPGDIVETMVSIYGMRRSLGGRHTAWMNFEWGAGVIDLRVRQRAPASRTIAELRMNHPPEPKIIERDGIIDKRWRALERKPIKVESLAPPWIIQNASIQFSEWRDWAEVIDVFAPLYEEQGPLPDEIEQEIARIDATEPTPAGRAAAILRFTQSAIRYLAISMGEGGYTPRSLAVICETRYGDCKDKAKLFVAMARKLRLEAAPALVDTRNGYALNEHLPSAQVFDHCIVRVVVDGAVYWIDGTKSEQKSPLSTLHQCHLGWALPLSRGATLERMADPTPAHTMETVEKIDLGPSPDHHVRYEWRSTSRRGRAEWVRELLAREGAVGMFKLYAADVERAFPHAQVLKQDVEHDDVDNNAITLVEAYDIGQAWTHIEKRAYQFATLDLTMKSQLGRLDAGTPKYPIYLGQLGKVSRRVEINAANNLALKGWSRSVEASALSYKVEFKKLTSLSAVLEETLEFKAITLPPSEADKYRALIVELEKTDIAITDTTDKKGNFLGTAEADKAAGGNVWIFHVLWVGAIVAYWYWRYVQG